jgi:hypothetical protein
LYGEFLNLSVPLVIAPLLLFLAVVAFLIPVLAKLLRQYHLKDVTPEWLESFSPSSYKPMEVLLADDDFNFLLGQPGFEASIGKKLRQDRVRIFRQYLNRLIRDFNRLHVYARFVISQNRESDQSAAFSRLIKLRIRFSTTVLRLELSLALAYFGFQPRLASRVVAQLTEMSECLYSLGPIPSTN